MWVMVLYDPDGCRIEFESNTLDPEEATLSQVRAATRPTEDPPSGERAVQESGDRGAWPVTGGWGPPAR